MALKNIFNEPRREIVEQVVGMGAVLIGIAAFCLADNWIAHALIEGDPYGNLGVGAARAISVVILMVGIIAVAVFTVLAHEIGDSICNAFQARGIHLRPRNRPVRR